MLLAADNLQITDKTIEQALKKMDPGPVQEMVVTCEKAGADIIDINTGPLGRDAEKKMAFFVEAVQDVTDLPVFIDTANPSAMEAGLKASRKKAIINSFSLEPAKLETILPLAKKYNTDIIGYLLYPDSHVPPDSTERLNIAVELLECALQAGIEKEQLILDPIIVPVTWQDGKAQALEILQVLRLLPEVMGFDIRTAAALSNLTSGGNIYEKKLFLERAYLPMLAVSGLDILLVNMLHTATIKLAKTCKMFSDEKVFSWEEI